jgi:hypothetical protein
MQGLLVVQGLHRGFLILWQGGKSARAVKFVDELETDFPGNKWVGWLASIVADM